MIINSRANGIETGLCMMTMVRMNSNKDYSKYRILDYEIFDFHLIWKLKLNSNAKRIYRLIKYEPYKNEIDVSSNPFKRYYGNPLRERLGSLHGDFDNDKASLVLHNITEEDDGMQIFCEIHWGNLYGESYGKVSLAKNEVTKGLSIPDNSCWKGSDDLWLNYR